MTIHDAKHYSRQALKHKFGNSYRHGYSKELRCNHRVRRTKVKCEVQWVIGDLSYSGHTAPYYHRSDGIYYWNVRYRIRRTNEYCVATGHSRRHCSKVFKGTY
jgi:hypothetical protein